MFYSKVKICMHIGVVYQILGYQTRERLLLRDGMEKSRTTSIKERVKATVSAIKQALLGTSLR